MGLEFPALWEVLRAGGLPAFLLLVLWLGAKSNPVWVWGSHYRKLEQDRDRWMQLALSTTSLAETSAKLAARTTEELARKAAP